MQDMQEACIERVVCGMQARCGGDSLALRVRLRSSVAVPAWYVQASTSAQMKLLSSVYAGLLLKTAGHYLQVPDHASLDPGGRGGTEQPPPLGSLLLPRVLQDISFGGIQSGPLRHRIASSTKGAHAIS